MSTTVGETGGVRVSVITPVYKGERFLSACLGSVGAQTVTCWEHVVVDDGSPDGARAIAEGAARADSRVRVISQPNGGVARARNRGIAGASDSADYVLLLDQDDLLEPDALERLTTYLDSHPASCAAFGPAVYCDEAGEVLPDEDHWLNLNFEVRRGAVRESTRRERTFAHLIAANPIATPGMCLIRRADLLRAGGLDGAMAPYDDWDLYLRLVQATGKTIDGIGGPHVMRWRQHGENNSRDQNTMAAGERRLFDKYLSGASGAEYAHMARLVRLHFRYGLHVRMHRTWAGRARHKREYRPWVLNELRAFRYGVPLWAHASAENLSYYIARALSPFRRNKAPFDTGAMVAGCEAGRR